MKTTIIVLALAMCAMGKGVAGEPLSDFSQALHKPKTGIQLPNPFISDKGIKKTQIYHIGKISSMPWTQIVAHEHMGNNAFYDGISDRPQMALFWIGATPQR